MLVLDEDESFSLQANVTSPGYQRMVMSGIITRQRGGKTEYTTLLPSYFYGWGGNQLSTWRQYIGATGAQTILSRSGGQPEPSGQRIWREMPQKTQKVTEVTPVTASITPYVPWIVVGVSSLILYLVAKK